MTSRARQSQQKIRSKISFDFYFYLAPAPTANGYESGVYDDDSLLHRWPSAFPTLDRMLSDDNLFSISKKQPRRVRERNPRNNL